MEYSSNIFKAKLLPLSQKDYKHLWYFVTKLWVLANEHFAEYKNILRLLKYTGPIIFLQKWGHLIKINK